MKHLWSLALIFLLCLSTVQAQQSPPFIFTVTGGLFFPARAEFSQVYQASSDLVWSVGAVFPGTYGVYFNIEYGKFTSTGFFDQAVDSGARYQEKFIHLGIINKRPLTQALMFRITAGVNRVNVSETTTTPKAPDTSIETGTLYGFY